MLTRSNVRLRLLLATAVTAGLVAACSDNSNVTAPSDAVFAKSGTAPSGGGGGGGGGGGKKSTDTTKNSTPSVGGVPVAPDYNGRITKIGVVPPGFYYGTPSDWEVGGYAFKSAFVTSYKPVYGPIVVGACVSVTFYEAAPERIMTEMKVQDPSKCQ